MEKHKNILMNRGWARVGISLVQYLQENTKIKCVSVDIFDTLVFRTVRRPIDVFEVMYEMGKEFLPDYIDAVEWRQIRIKAEKKARDCKMESHAHMEVTLEEIYQQMPHIVRSSHMLRMLELETEKQICVLNIALYKQLQLLKEQGYRLIVMSDMYFSGADICELFESLGVDTSMFEKVYVSSEYGKSKKEGNLFDYVLANLKLEPDEVLHCGDNLQGDIAQAKKRGILTCYYPVISEAQYRYTFFDLEVLRYSDICTEIFFLRNLVADENPYKGEDKIWYEIGGMILGPLFTFATEWFLDQAEKNNINQIYPLMREGKILSELLGKAAQARKLEMVIEPLYVSRKVVYEALKANITREDIKSTYETVYYKVKDIFSFYNILDLANQFECYLDYEISELRKIGDSDKCIYDVLFEYLTDDNMISIIRERHSGAMSLIQQYFKQKHMDNPFITIDIGWNGRTASGIQKILDISGINTKYVNLFVAGKYGALDYIYEGTDIRGYVGSFGKNMENLSEWYAFIAEMLSMCNEGTTIGYFRKETDEIIPLCKENTTLYDQQMQKISYCHEGIMKFQELYLDYACVNKRIADVKYKETELCQIVSRMYAAPTVAEAHLLGDLEYDVNMGAETCWKIVSQDVLQKYKEESFDVFCSKHHERYVEWLSGMNVLKDPFVYYRTQAILHCRYFMVKIMYFLERILQQTEDKLILVGAGDYGRNVYKLLQYIGKAEQIEGYLDNNSVLHGTSIFGIPIYGIEHNFVTKNYVICTANAFYIEALRKQIREVKGEEVDIYSYFDDV